MVYAYTMVQSDGKIKIIKVEKTTFKISIPRVVYFYRKMENH